MQVTINALSADSIEKAAKRVRRLQRTYERKNRQFVQELTKAGIEVISTNLLDFNEGGDYRIPTTNKPHVMMGNKDGNLYATLRLRGEDVLFIEFGAGVHYNTPAGTSPHPMGVELGYTIGSYGQGQGANDYWYFEEDGMTFKTHGTKAMMPMYKADIEIRQRFVEIARSVFGS